MTVIYKVVLHVFFMRASDGTWYTHMCVEWLEIFAICSTGNL